MSLIVERRSEVSSLTTAAILASLLSESWIRVLAARLVGEAQSKLLDLGRGMPRKIFRDTQPEDVGHNIRHGILQRHVVHRIEIGKVGSAQTARFRRAIPVYAHNKWLACLQCLHKEVEDFWNHLRQVFRDRRS